MRRIPRLLSLLFALACLSGCVITGGQIDRDKPFTSASPGALLVFGVDVQSQYKSPSLVFLQYDPATGKGLPESTRHVSPRQDDLSAGQRFGAFMTGQQSLPNRRSLFVVELPAGDWILWCVTGYMNDGLGTSTSSVSYMAQGTLAVKAEPGKATYVGEFEINGEFGDDLQLVELPRSFDKARSDLAAYQNVQVELQDTPFDNRRFTCERRRVMLTETPCARDTVIVLPPGST